MKTLATKIAKAYLSEKRKYVDLETGVVGYESDFYGDDKITLVQDLVTIDPSELFLDWEEHAGDIDNIREIKAHYAEEMGISVEEVDTTRAIEYVENDSEYNWDICWLKDWWRKECVNRVINNLKENRSDIFYAGNL